MSKFAIVLFSASTLFASFPDEERTKAFFSSFAGKDAVRVGFEKSEVLPENLPLEKPHDFVLSVAAVHYVQDQQALFKRMAKSLNKNGKMVLSFCAIKHDPVLLSVHQVTMKRFWHSYFRGYRFPCRAFDKGTYHSFLRRAGLTPLRIERVAIDDTLESKKEFAEWLAKHLPQLKVLPSHLHALFINDVIKCYLKKYPLDSEGQVHVYDYHWEIEACLS